MNNKETIATYEKSFDDYLSWTATQVWGDFKVWIDTLLWYIPKEKKILELWTGFWRDADYMEDQWYHVQRSDIVDAFIDHNKRQDKDILKIDILNLPTHKKYDVIFANAVLLHFTHDESEKIVDDIREMLEEGGFFAFTVQSWSWNEVRFNKVNLPRFFQYWWKEELEERLFKKKFLIRYIALADQWKWIHIICEKQHS